MPPFQQPLQSQNSRPHYDPGFQFFGAPSGSSNIPLPSQQANSFQGQQVPFQAQSAGYNSQFNSFQSGQNSGFAQAPFQGSSFHFPAPQNQFQDIPVPRAVAPPQTLDQSAVLSMMASFMPQMMKDALQSLGFSKPTAAETQSTPVLTPQESMPGPSGFSASASGPPANKRRRIDGEEEVLYAASGDEDQEDDYASIPDTSSVPELYRDKLRLVRELEKLETEETVKSNPMVMSVEPEERKARLSLPPSAGFLNKFEDFTKVLKGQKAIKGTQKQVFTSGKFPRLFKPSPSLYSIPECPWKAESLGLGSDLLAATNPVYNSTHPPQVSVDEAVVKKLESSVRQSLNVASYMDHFMFASRELIKGSQEKLDLVQAGDSLSFPDVCEIYDDNKKALGLLQSAAKALSDISVGLVERAGCLVTLRRDAWIKGMPFNLPQVEKLRLRSLSLNADFLFPTEEIEVSKKCLKDYKEGKLQDQVLNSQLRSYNIPKVSQEASSKPSEQSSTSTHYNRGGRGRGGRGGTFRGGRGGRGGTGSQTGRGGSNAGSSSKSNTGKKRGAEASKDNQN